MKHVDLIVTEVQAVTVRDVAGAGQQAELLVRTKGGELAIRLVGHKGGAIRLTDLRHRDRKRRKNGPLAEVSMAEAFPDGHRVR